MASKKKIDITNNSFTISFFKIYRDEYVIPKFNKLPLSDKGLYAHRIWEKFQSILESENRIIHSLFFIENFSPTKKQEKIHLTRPKYYEYHLSMYYIVFCTYLDQCVLLINEVYNLGLKESEANRKTVIENLNCQRDILKQFTIMEDFISNKNPFKKLRNHFVHRGNIEINEFIGIAEDIDFDKDMKKIGMDFGETGVEYYLKGKKNLKDKLIELKALHSKMNSFIGKLLDLLEPVLANKVSSMK